MNMEQQSERNTTPMVSIIVPVYNAGRFIEQTIGSVLGQDYTDWELILVNDCSTDNSAEIISKYASDGRVRLVNMEKNGGAAVARNKGIDMARGRYIAFLDSDDLWQPRKLSLQLALMAEQGCAFCFTEIEMIDESGTTRCKPRHIPAKVDYSYLLKKTVIATSSVIIDKEITGHFAMPQRRSGQDYATWLMLLRRVQWAYCLQEPLVKYRVVRHSLSSNKLSSLKQVYDIQTKNEHLPAWRAAYDTCRFALYAFKKHFC